MSAVAALRDVPRVREAAAAEGIGVVLIGTGLVGGALLRRFAAGVPLRLVGIVNSRQSLVDARGVPADHAAEWLQASDGANLDAAIAALLASPVRHRVVIDATPADAVAARHAEWLAAGLHVVTANKLAQGTDIGRWHALREAERRGGTRYGDAATVGAGLPVLSTLRRLVRSGDRIQRIEGVFSGSLSFLFNTFDGSRPFSRLLADAFERGYTEPDPRADLSGADVARKLVILARSAGHAIAAQDVEVESFLSPEVAALPYAQFVSRLPELDAEMEARRATASKGGAVLRYVAEFSRERGARVALKAVSTDTEVAQLDGADNLFVIYTQRYGTRPLIVRGAGAGADVTAAALLADVLEIQGISSH